MFVAVARVCVIRSTIAIRQGGGGRFGRRRRRCYPVSWYFYPWWQRVTWRVVVLCGGDVTFALLRSYLSYAVCVCSVARGEVGASVNQRRGAAGRYVLYGYVT